MLITFHYSSLLVWQFTFAFVSFPILGQRFFFLNYYFLGLNGLALNLLLTT